MNIDKIIQLGIESKLLHESETKEEIFECGVEVWISGQRGLDALEKFAALVASAEREECAKVCEDAPEPDGADLAERIRARGQA